MFIVQLKNAILYPECINTKTSTASCMRWEQNHLYCVATRTSHTHRCCFARGSNKVKGFFFRQCPVAAFLGGRRRYEGWHDGKLSCWIYECSIRRVFPVWHTRRGCNCCELPFNACSGCMDEIGSVLKTACNLWTLLNKLTQSNSVSTDGSLS